MKSFFSLVLVMALTGNVLGQPSAADATTKEPETYKEKKTVIKNGLLPLPNGKAKLMKPLPFPETPSSSPKPMPYSHKDKPELKKGKQDDIFEKQNKK